MVYSIYIVIYSPDLLVFACRWPFKLLSLWILCNKQIFSDTPPRSLTGIPGLFHIPNGFTVKRSTRILCQCDTSRAGHFTLDAHASTPVACACAHLSAHSGRKHLILSWRSPWSPSVMLTLCSPVMHIWLGVHQVSTGWELNENCHFILAWVTIKPLDEFNHEVCG